MDKDDEKIKRLHKWVSEHPTHPTVRSLEKRLEREEKRNTPNEIELFILEERENGRTLREIAAILGITRQAVEQKEKVVFKKISWWSHDSEQS